MSDLLKSYDEYVEIMKKTGAEINLAEEDFAALTEEQLQELSNKTLSSYKEKAEKSFKKSFGSKDGKDAQIVSKRLNGLSNKKITDLKDDVNSEKKETIDEGLKLLKTHSLGDHHAKVYKDSEWGEHRVKFFHGTHHLKNADYHTDDHNDAHDTAKTELKRLNKYTVGHMPEENTNTEEDTISETSTQASETVKPNSKPADNPKSRIEMMADVLKGMDAMPKKDFVKWFDQAMSQFGPGKTYGVGDNSAKNAASTDTTLGAGPKTKAPMPKLSVKEDMDNIFEGSELSEEFKEKASTLFETAIHARLVLETARLEEEFETALEEQVLNITKELTEKVDVYMDYVVEEWMKENKVAIESSLRNELIDDFVSGLKNLFTEHYIDVPQEKLDVLEALSTKVQELEGKLNEKIEENVDLKKIAASVKRDEVFDEVSEGLAMSQVERFKTLAESIEFDGDITAYKKKLKTIKESYFKEPTKNFISEEVNDVTDSNTEEVVVSKEMQFYADAISRTLKKN